MIRWQTLTQTFTQTLPKYMYSSNNSTNIFTKEIWGTDSFWSGQWTMVKGRCCLQLVAWEAIHGYEPWQYLNKGTIFIIPVCTLCVSVPNFIHNVCKFLMISLISSTSILVCVHVWCTGVEKFGSCHLVDVGRQRREEWVFLWWYWET